MEKVGGREDGQGNGPKGEINKSKQIVKIGGRIVSGGHCHLQQNVLHEL